MDTEEDQDILEIARKINWHKEQIVKLEMQIYANRKKLVENYEKLLRELQKFEEQEM